MRPLTGLRKVKSFQFYASKHFDTSGDKLPLSERGIGIQTVHFLQYQTTIQCQIMNKTKQILDSIFNFVTSK